MMVETSINSMEQYIMYEAMFREPTTFVGYPTTKDNGSFVTNDGAWQ